MKQEIWKPVIGFEDYYEVSDLGDIRRKSSKRVRKINYSTIYPTITLSVDAKTKIYRVHRIVALAFLEKETSRTHVNHINGDKTDNRVVNLEWVTQSENNLHSYRVLGKDNPMLGIEPHNKILQDSDFEKINALNKRGMKTDDIGKLYNVCGSTVRKLLRRVKKRNKKQIKNKYSNDTANNRI